MTAGRMPAPAVRICTASIWPIHAAETTKTTHPHEGRLPDSRAGTSSHSGRIRTRKKTMTT